jgi:hypothetical protein
MLMRVLTAKSCVLIAIVQHHHEGRSLAEANARRSKDPVTPRPVRPDDYAEQPVAGAGGHPLLFRISSSAQLAEWAAAPVVAPAILERLRATASSRVTP